MAPGPDVGGRQAGPGAEVVPGLSAIAFRDLLDTRLLAVAVIDRELRLQYVNDYASEVMATPRDDLIGRPIAEFVPLEDVDGRLEDVTAVLVKGAPTEFEARILRADGAELPIDAQLVPLHDDGGDLVGVAVFARVLEATEPAMRRLQRELRESLALANEVDEALWRIERVPEFHYTYLNPAAEQLLDVTIQEMRDDPDLPLRRVHPEDRPRMAEGREHPAGAVWPMQLRWRRRDGGEVTLLVREVPVVDDDGAVTATLGIARQISDPGRESFALRNALEREQAASEHLRRIDEMRRAFLRAVSHELRTPLTAVVGYAETLRYHRERLTGDRGDELVDRLLRNASRLRSLLDDLLDIDRLSRGTLSVDVRDVDLADIVLGAVDVIEARPGQVRVTAEPTTCRVDPPKIERIVDNLVGNALKHGGVGVTVWVGVGERDGHAVLEVSDDGPGVSEDLKGRIFLPFEQGAASATAASPGTGLGLTLVREFTRLHGGSVEVDDRPGGGARFVVKLPLAD